MIVRVDGVPAPKGSARAIKVGKGDKARAVLVASSSGVNERAQKSWSNAVAWAAKAARQGAAPMVGPVGVRIAFYLPRPKSVRRPWPTVAPDLDKILRATFDALTGIAWVDDAQVVTVEPLAPGAAMKLYADGVKPGALIDVYQLPAEPARSNER